MPHVYPKNVATTGRCKHEVFTFAPSRPPPIVLTVRHTHTIIGEYTREENNKEKKINKKLIKPCSDKVEEKERIQVRSKKVKSV